MQIIRIVSDSKKSALEQASEKLGPKGIILSQRLTEEGYEVVAAINSSDIAPIPSEVAKKDVEEAEMPKQLSNLHEQMSDLKSLLETQNKVHGWSKKYTSDPEELALLKHLLKQGFPINLVKETLNDIKQAREPFTEEVAEGMILNQVITAPWNLQNNGGWLMLIGPTGVGKTTTLAKIAYHYVLEHSAEDVAVISTDNYRVGAIEQLRIYMKTLGVDYYVSKNSKQIEELVFQLAERKIVLVDTAGMSQKDIELVRQVKMLSEKIKEVKTLLTVSAASQRFVIDDTFAALSDIDIHGCILTKTDETSSLGQAIAALIEHEIPLRYISNGQRVPEDLKVARASYLKELMSEMASRRQNIEYDEDILASVFSQTED